MVQLLLISPPVGRVGRTTPVVGLTPKIMRTTHYQYLKLRKKVHTEFLIKFSSTEYYHFLDYVFDIKIDYHSGDLTVTIVGWTEY